MIQFIRFALHMRLWLNWWCWLRSELSTHTHTLTHAHLSSAIEWQTSTGTGTLICHSTNSKSEEKSRTAWTSIGNKFYNFNWSHNVEHNQCESHEIRDATAAVAAIISIAACFGDKSGRTKGHTNESAEEENQGSNWGEEVGAQR